MNKLPLKSKRKIKTLLGLTISIFFVAVSILCSEVLIKKTLSGNENTVYEADETYYLAAKSKLAKNASMNLSYADRIKLVSGSWAGTFKECSLDSGFISETEAVSLAKKQLDYFYEAEVYPYSLTPTYDNWYSWEAKLYEYTDNTFNTYTVYLWCIKFIKYDNSLVHTVLMTENGTIINAEVRSPSKTGNPIINAYLNDHLSYDLSELLGDSSLSLIDYTDNEDDITIPYTQVDTSSLQIINSFNITIYQTHKSSNDFIIYQYKTDTSYGIGIMPK